MATNFSNLSLAELLKRFAAIQRTEILWVGVQEISARDIAQEGLELAEPYYTAQLSKPTACSRCFCNLNSLPDVNLYTLGLKIRQGALRRSCRKREAKTGSQGQILRKGVYAAFNFCSNFCSSILRGVSKAGCYISLFPLLICSLHRRLFRMRAV